MWVLPDQASVFYLINSSQSNIHNVVLLQKTDWQTDIENYIATDKQIITYNHLLHVCHPLIFKVIMLYNGIEW